MMSRLPSAVLSPNQPMITTWIYFSRRFLQHRSRIFAGQSTSPPSEALEYSTIQNFVDECKVSILTHPPAEACGIKCLVFLAGPTPVLVIIRLEDRVSEASLASHLRLPRRSIRMAPVNELIPLTGFTAGEVPPFGHRRALQTIMDERLAHHEHVVFGRNDEFVMRSADLLRATSASIGSVAAAISPDDPRGTHLSSHMPIPWPPGASHVTITGIVAQKRKIANLLVFLNVVPVSAEDTTPLKAGSAAYLRRVWTHPENGKPCEVQAILGKTMERRLGRASAIEFFKSLRIGQHVQITGCPQDHVPEAGGSASTPRFHILDLVAHELQVLSTPRSSEEVEDSGAADQSIKKSQSISLHVSKRDRHRHGDANGLYKHSVPLENIILVNNVDSLRDMERVLFENQRSGSVAEALPRVVDPVEGRWRPSLVVGLDAEWQPSSRENPSPPVSLLQIGTATHVFLVDMLALCRPGEPPSAQALSSSQLMLSDLVTRLFADEHIVKVGFGLRYDIKRLVESYPWLPCFGGSNGNSGRRVASEEDVDLELEKKSKRSLPIRSHVDVLLLARAAGDGHTSYKRLGLSTLCSMVLGGSLDKGEQRSDWGARPLTASQVSYAATDVVCLVDMFNFLVTSHPYLLERRCMEQCAAHLTDIGDFVRMRPSSSSTEEDSTDLFRNKGHIADQGLTGLPSDAHVVARGGRGRSTHLLPCNTEVLMRYLGTAVPGGGKVAVVRLAGMPSGESQNSNKGAATPHFPRGSGVLEFQDRTFLLFVSVPSPKYPNAFTLGEHDDCEMTWWPGKGQTLEHPVVKRLLDGPHDPRSSGGMPSTVLLFCRPGRDDYVCCGKLEVASIANLDGQLRVTWRLIDFPLLRENLAFQRILDLQQK